MRIECKNCGGAHPTWDCKRPAKEMAMPEVTPDQISLVDRGRGPHKSTAARKDVLIAPLNRGSVDSATSQRDKVVAPLSSPPAGTQALPVETVQKPPLLAPSDPLRSGSATSDDAVGEASEAKFDKKAWMREYMREHRKGIRRRVEPKQCG